MNPTTTSQTQFNPEQGPEQVRPSEAFGLGDDNHNPADFNGMEDAIKEGRALNDTRRQSEIAQGMEEAGFSQETPSPEFDEVLGEALPTPEGTNPTTESIGETAVSGSGIEKDQ